MFKIRRRSVASEMAMQFPQTAYIKLTQCNRLTTVLNEQNYYFIRWCHNVHYLVVDIFV